MIVYLPPPPSHTPLERTDLVGQAVVWLYKCEIVFTASVEMTFDLEVQGLEAAWVEIRVKSKTLLVGGFYRPPNSNAAYFELISKIIHRAYNINIIDILRRF